MPATVRLHRFGLLPYHDAWDWQRQTAAAVRDGAPEALALLQHPHVYTFGRRVHPENLLLPPADAEVIESDRGGDVTYHGPGQLVAYPILNLHRRRLGATDYVRLLEQTMIRTAAAFNVAAHRVPGRPGIWVEAAKLGAIGVRVQGGVTTHGLALNVHPDLTRYEAIIPCGLTDITVTSLARQLSYTPNLEDAEDAFLQAFEAVFNCYLETTPMQSPSHHEPPQPLSVDGEGRAAAGVRFDAPNHPSARSGRGGAAHARGVRGVSPQVTQLEGRSRQVLPKRTQDAQSRKAVRLAR